MSAAAARSLPDASAAAALLGLVADGVCVLYGERRVTWHNAALARLVVAATGDSAALIGRPLAVVLPWLADALAAGQASVAHGDRAYEVASMPLDDGVALVVRAAPADAGELARAETAHTARYRALFDAVPLPLVAIDRASRTILAANRAMVRQFGAGRAMEGRAAESLFAPADLAAMLVDDTAEGLARSGGSRSGEAPSGGGPSGAPRSLGLCRLLQGEGRTVEAEVETFALDFGGRPALMAMVRDVTVARRTEAERALLLAAVARINDLLVITSATPDANGVLPIVFVNEAFERHTGWQRHEVIGKPVTILEGPGTDAALLARLQEHVRRGESLRAEVLHYTRDGAEYWVEMVMGPLYDAEGVHTHWVSVHRDVSERKRLEEQLFQAQKMEAVGRLAGGVAHDFNNVLTAISGFSELLLEELPAGEGPHEEVLQIRAAAARATALTRQLLAFSRKQILRPRLVDVGTLVRELERLLQRAVTEEVTIRMTVAAFTSPVLADPVQLEQVLLNLAVNASEAMPDGGMISIEVSDIALGESYAHRHHGVQPGHYVCLTVTDTGVGMDRATRERIFEPFYTTKPGGTGLGLSTVYGIVRQSGGHLWVYSEPGTGSTFKIYLPVATSDVPVAEPEPVLDGSLGGTETILVVEDEALVRDVTRAMLVRRGYTVLLANDGDHAMRVAADYFGTIDLVLTDGVMPRANGRRVAERLRMLRPGVRVLFMSGYTEDAIVHHGVLEPGIVLLEKPFTEQDLARTVRAVLDAPLGS